MHTFHIPVMGTGFTVDSALSVAKFGISSAISLVDDLMIEQMRKYHAERVGEPYEEITNQDEDPRARRITLYLNLINLLVERQMKVLKAMPFSDGSDIVRYFELMPESSIRELYEKMLGEEDSDEKARMQDHLRTLVVAGSIDVNIMTKLDRENYRGGEKRPPEFADALAALRGFGQSDLSSSIIFSAGINKRLLTYLTQFEDFFPTGRGEFKKKVTLKVSDYRSAEVQGNFLAKRGIWVSEFRVESGLNCGGHTFPSTGNLIGPILEDFKAKKKELIEKLFAACNKTWATNDREELDNPPAVKFTVQGGIGSHSEDELMLGYYNMDSTGWGTPWLLVPEVTNVDKVHLDKLLSATDEEVYLSYSTPLLVPFWNLRNSGSENARRERISKGVPGSLCPKGYLRANTEFTEKPICLASRAYQKLKLESNKEQGYTEEQLEFVTEHVLNKSCICNDLAGSVQIKNGIEPNATPAFCCGPNMVYFTKLVTLEDMVNYIYGRLNQLATPGRPHMFIQELKLNIDYLREELEKFSLQLSNRKQKYFNQFKENLINGIEYYKCLRGAFKKEELSEFLDNLKSLNNAVEALDLESVAAS